MTKVTVGDILKTQSQTATASVNCVGVMGKGIALAFKEHFPAMYKDYVRRCSEGKVKLGRPYLYKRVTQPWILVFPTKDHWRSLSRLSDIERGLDYLLAHHKSWGIQSLAVPPLGCGLGGLQWSIVGRILYKKLSQLDIPVSLYAPHEAPTEQLTEDYLLGGEGSPHLEKSIQRGTVGRALLAEVVSRLIERGYRRPIGRTLLQKLAYFGTELGLPTRLHFERGSYGPYSAHLKEVMSDLVNNGILEERRALNGFSFIPGPAFDDFKKAITPYMSKYNKVIDRLVDLFARLDTRQAELAATVHFAARDFKKRRRRLPTIQEIAGDASEWKKRRRPSIPKGEIEDCAMYLAASGWIEAAPSLTHA